MTKNLIGVSESGPTAGRYGRDNTVMSAHQAADTIGLKDVWFLVKRRIRIIFIIVLVCTGLAAIAAFTVSKTYTARSAVVLERKDIRPFATDASLQSLDRDRSAAETEMDILRSRQFAGRVVDRLTLIDDPNFNPYAQKVEGTRETKLSNPTTATSDKQIQRDRAISTLLTQYEVRRTGDSLAVEITVSNPNPQLAASIANTIAGLYVESSLEFKQDERIADKNRALSTRGAVGFLRQSIAQPLLVTLRSEEARLQQVRDELAVRFGKNHPQIVASDSQIASVQSMIDSEVQRIILDLEAESLKPSARILSLAEVPSSPSFPKPRIIIPVAFVGSALLAFLLAIMLEATDTRIRSGKRTSQLLQVPNLGYASKIPRKKFQVSMSKLPSFLAIRRSLTFTEAERSIYLASRFPSVGKANNVVMISSCTNSKTSASMAWGVAASAAADGRSTLFIDLDFSKHVAVLTEIPRSPPVFERYLGDETFLAEVIQKIPNLPRLGFIDATGALQEPSRSLNSKRLLELFAAIKKIGYDFIVLHSPPVLASGDANWLSPFVNGVILSAIWGKTTEEQLLEAASQLRMNGAHLIGTVIDEVNSVVHAKHGYGDSVLTAEFGPVANLSKMNAKEGTSR